LIKVGIGGTETKIGAGRKNTALILATDANAPAAKTCKDYRGGGLSDWFLPSKDELNELYKNKDLVGNMGTDWYWSSSQDQSNDAWCQGFIYGSQVTGFKDNNYYVRPIRVF